MTKDAILVYGSYGYTGKLIVDELKQYGRKVILSGRNEKLLKLQSEQTGYPFKVVDLDDHIALANAMTDVMAVIHCAGPFQFTAATMVEACLKTRTHYTDITGEFQVFELLQRYDKEAREAGITILPGTGFDVVPSDCLAAHLKSRLPDATHLELAFTNPAGGFSRGTARTGIENLGEGSFVREHGEIKRIPAGSRNTEIDFGKFKALTTCIPWGDISTAFFSTRIPNISVFMGVPEKTIRFFQWSNRFSWLLRQRWVKSWLRKKIDARPAGPSDERRSKGRSYLWGKVKNASGDTRLSLLEAPDGYTLTAKTSALIAEEICKGNVTPGFATPSSMFGKDFILRIENTTRTDL